MKRITPYVMVVIAAALVVGALLQRDAAAQRAPTPSPARYGPGSGFPRFEYATLRYDMPSDRWTWTTPDDVKRGDKRRLFREMDGAFKPGDRDREITYIELATQAGLFGWELTTVVEREKGTEIWFKRPVR